MSLPDMAYMKTPGRLKPPALTHWPFGTCHQPCARYSVRLATETIATNASVTSAAALWQMVRLNLTGLGAGTVVPGRTGPGRPGPGAWTCACATSNDAPIRHATPKLASEALIALLLGKQSC